MSVKITHILACAAALSIGAISAHAQMAGTKPMTRSSGMKTSMAASTDVMALQEALNKNGASLTADGKFGPKTRAALVKYQTANMLTPNGRPDMATRSKLGITTTAYRDDGRMMTGTSTSSMGTSTTGTSTTGTTTRTAPLGPMGTTAGRSGPLPGATSGTTTRSPLSNSALPPAAASSGTMGTAPAQAGPAPGTRQPLSNSAQPGANMSGSGSATASPSTGTSTMAPGSRQPLSNSATPKTN